MSLGLIQELYNPAQTLPADPAFYEEAWEDIGHFHVAPQIYGILKQQGRLAAVPGWFQARLKEAYENMLPVAAWIQLRQRRILQALEDAAIPAIPLKGVRFAHKYFGHIGYRGTSDIDLLVPEDRLGEAAQIVSALGFTDDEPLIPGHFHRSLSMPVPHSAIPLTVELHWHVLRPDTSELNIAEFWREAAPLGEYRYIKELSDYHTFYMICIHGWRHNLDSLKHMIDIAQLLHSLSGSIDFDRLWREVEIHKTKRRVRRMLAIMFHHIPQLAPYPVEPSLLWWSYRTIRYREQKSLAAYLHWMYYECCDYDTPKHALTASYQWLIGNLRQAFKK